MRDNGGGEAPGAEIDRLARNQRLAAFVAEVREAEAKGEQRPFAESDRLLAAMAEDALAYQDKVAVYRAEVARRQEAYDLDRRAAAWAWEAMIAGRRVQ